MERNYIDVAKSWLSDSYDVETRQKVNMMLNSGDPKELEDAFYRTLEFGTGGLRGIMGVGTNRMNKYTVGMATQGLANYLKMHYADLEKINVAISYDSRNNSREFALITAQVLGANEIHVYLFDNLRPLPELSYTIRELGCQAGVMITASHNPKEYNGYKVFWADGAQVTPPHDGNIIAEVNKITDPSQVKFGDGTPYNITSIGAEMDEKYLNAIMTLTLSPEAVKNNADLKIVYTPIHGTGVRLVPEALRRVGFTNIITVADQEISDGNFPTVMSPNPEEPSALKMAIDLAEKEGANLVMATDPDADRVGIAVRDNEGKMVLMNGNQTASILTYYILTRWQELGKLSDKNYLVKTIVTTELLVEIAKKFGVQIYDVLTGFKYIAQIIRENEGERVFICGGEESYGFNIGEFVRDKDAVNSCKMIAECAAWAADQGMTLYQLLQKIYAEFGIFIERLLSVTLKGKDGAEQIAQLMKDYRATPPTVIGDEKVVKVIDYNKPEETGLPKSNVLRFFGEGGSVVTVRPSGTEPKIKYYFGAKGDTAEAKIEMMKAQFQK
ncbi:MAG: phospho-sugar mutase [Bacteroidales bacterium]|nr:phospho-sugar mutase [Bacteroidales bacterium]